MRKLCLLVVLTLLMFGCQSKEEKELYKEIVLIHQEQKFQEVIIKSREFKEKFPNSENIKEIDEKIAFAEEIIKKEKSEKIKNLLNNFDKEYDEFNDISFYNVKPYLRYYRNIHVYIGQSGKTYKVETNNIWFRIEYTYLGDEWVFFDTIKIKTDENLYTISLTNEEYRDRYTDTLLTGSVVEIINLKFTEKDIPMLKDIVNSKEVKIRYVGDKKIRDINLFDNDKKNLAKVLEIIELHYGV